jgi:phage-related tail fiber protein
MANLPEPPEWPDGIYQIETPDPVLGGPDGIANKAAKALASRTVWLRNRIEALVEGTVSAFKATRLATARKLSISGAASGFAQFDGSADANIAITLADSGVAAGAYQKVTVSVKGLVTAGSALAASDIPNLDWSKIVSGKPTTLGGYGITDSASGVNGTALVARKLETTRSISISGAAGGSAAFDGSANVGIAITLVDSGVVAGSYPKVTVNAKGLVVGNAALLPADIPGLDWSKITSGKPTTLAGYGITDTYTAIQTNQVVNNAIAAFSAPNIGVPALVNGFADGNTSRFWKANGNVYVSLDITRWVSNGAGALLIFTLPPGFRPLIRVCGTGDWVTQSPIGFGFLSWRAEASGEVVLDYSIGSTAGAGGYACQISFCVQAV